MKKNNGNGKWIADWQSKPWSAVLLATAIHCERKGRLHESDWYLNRAVGEEWMERTDQEHRLGLRSMWN